MTKVEIVKGNQKSENGGRLNLMALEAMADPLVGTTDKRVAEHALAQLWQQKENRFSHEFAYEAKLEQKTLGLVTCYSVKKMDQLALTTTEKLLKIRRWPLIAYAAGHLRTIYNLLTLKEGREDEFHIGTLATLPESRGMGVGTQLIHHAEQMARQNGFKKISLTVKQHNTQARKLYERLGFVVTDQISKNPFFLYRMVKPLA